MIRTYYRIFAFGQLRSFIQPSRSEMAPTTSADSGSSKPNQPYDILENGYLIPSEDTILIAVMGVTGSGKSQLINTLKAERVIYNKDNGGKRESIYAEVGKGLKSRE